jgi:hypothetical protein
VEGSCEHGNEPLGSTKCWDYFLSACAIGSFPRRAQLREWVSVFSLWYLCYHQVDTHHQHRPTADVFHLISVPPGSLRVVAEEISKYKRKVDLVGVHEVRWGNFTINDINTALRTSVLGYLHCSDQASEISYCNIGITFVKATLLLWNVK